jgi:predicted MPP superfamily phosphohydrolase
VRTLAFILVAFTVVAGGHWYLWSRLVRDPALPEPWHRVLTVLFVVAALALPLGIVASRLWPGPATRVLAAVLFTWMGTAVILLGAVLAADVVRLLAAGASWLADLARGSTDPPADPERRVFVARAVAGGAALAAGAASAFAVREALAEPRIHEVPVRLERLPPGLSGLSIAQISDLHVGPTIGEKEVRRVVELTNRLRPDVVAITGDLVDGSVAQLRRATEALAGLRARHGVYFVTGNHEYYSGHEAWQAELTRYGIRVLDNERVVIGDRGPGGVSLDLAGLPDWSAGALGPERAPDLGRTLAGRDPDRALVLLSHQPRRSTVGEAVRAGVELTLSGHTHGGQIFPWSLLVGALFPYLRGLYTHVETGREGQVFVSCGTGYWGPPLRLGAPAEISRIVLTP